MVETRTIKITNLLVNTENYRFEPVGSQKEAIDKMVANQGIKLYYLAEDIVEKGLNPNDRTQVYLSHHDKTKFIVLEGNRRVVALKLLLNPDLLDGSEANGLKDKFRKLHAKIKDHLIEEIECNFYDDPKDAEHWIGIKHGYGNGISTERWDVYQKTRFEEETMGKSSLVSQTIKILKESPYISKKIKENIPSMKLTNLHRLISDPGVRDFMGLDFKKGVLQSKINEKESMKALEKVAEDCLDPKFKVREIYTKEDRKEYINQFPKSNIPDKNKKLEDKSSGDTKDESSIKIGRRISSERRKLIPGPCKLSIKNPKINAIYYELQKLDVEKYPNAVSVLFRVFIELSLDTFLENNNMIKGVTATKEKLRLDEKLNKVTSYLTSKNVIDNAISKGIKVATSNSNHLLGIDTWHAYIHNNRFSPSPKDLITTWDNIQTFVEKVWENIK